jgi:V8-like Glu-specific endopeptidase
MRAITKMSVGASASFLVGVAAAAFASGCAVTASDEGAEEALEASGDELRNGSFYYGVGVGRGAVGIRFWAPGWGEWQTCSGQVVSKRTILTAAHCVIRATVGDNPGSATITVWRPSSQSSHVVVLDTQTVTGLYNPSHDGSTPFDVALFVASTDFQNVTSGDAARVAKTTPTGVQMHAVGFGAYGEGSQFVDDSGRVGAVTPSYASKALEYFFENTGNQPEICAGDSGGPLKRTTSGVLQVYGVAHGNTGGGAYCGEVGHWATTKHNMDWLRGKISGTCSETSTYYSCW